MRTISSRKDVQIWVIPATDLLKVSECIKKQRGDFLTDSFFTDAYDFSSKQINEFLNRVYDPKSEHSWYLRIAAIYIFITTIDSILPVDRNALNIMFTCLINQNTTLPILPVCMCRYSLLNEPYMNQPSSPDTNVEQEILRFLLYLKQTYISAAMLLQNIECEIKLLGRDIDMKMTAKYSSVLFGFLRNKLSFRTGDIVDQIGVTKITAIRYTQILEESGFVTSIKSGREKTYINNYLFSCIDNGELYGS